MRKLKEFIDRLLEEVSEALAPAPELEPIPVRVDGKPVRRPRQ